MRLYLYSECCNRKGQVAGVVESGDDDDFADNNDLFCAGEGTRDEIIADAIASLALRRDHRPGGAGDSFRWSCDRSILAYLDGPAVEYDADARAYRVVAETD